MGPYGLGLSPRLRRALVASNPDIVHTHGIWMHPSAATVAWASGRKPYLVSPHGMLDPWALARSGTKKRLARLLYEDRHLRGSACLHALCAPEATAIRAFGLKSPICTIPNGVDIPPPGPPPAAPWAGRVEPGKRVLLFLGRLHPKKNVHGLIEGLATIARDADLRDWHLVVAGWDQGGYQGRVAALVAERGLANHVTFVGPLHGQDKDAALRNATAFVLPSFSEGLPVAVLEAWAYGLPVAMTVACNLPEGFVAGAAYEISAEPDPMAAHLAEFLSADPRELSIMGKHGTELVRTKFSWERVGRSFADVYAWLLGGGSAPDCVRSGRNAAIL